MPRQSHSIGVRQWFTGPGIVGIMDQAEALLDGWRCDRGDVPVRGWSPQLISWFPRINRISVSVFRPRHSVMSDWVMRHRPRRECCRSPSTISRRACVWVSTSSSRRSLFLSLIRNRNGRMPKSGFFTEMSIRDKHGLLIRPPDCTLWHQHHSVRTEVQRESAGFR